MEDLRQLCHFCVKEGRKNPKIGFLWYDLDGTGRKAVCGEHLDIATKNAQMALIREATGQIDAVDGEKRPKV